VCCAGGGGREWPAPAKPQLKRKDQLLLYATTAGQFGALVDYSGKQCHRKHNTISTKHGSGQTTEYIVPSGYHTEGVPVPSTILQRSLREYKNLSKRIILTGNDKYVYISTDARFSLHRSDNLYGTLDVRDDDVTVELSIATLSRVLKVTQFNRTVNVVCEPGLPVRLTSHLGRCGSCAHVFIQQESPKT
jgi:hypothetical protein